MKKLLLTTAIIMAMGGTAALAHHPAEDMVDPDIYAMINENLLEADSPHLDMTFDDMGGMTSDSNSDNASESSTFAGAAASDGMGREDADEVGAATESADGVRNSGIEEGGDFESAGAQFSENVEDVGSAENQREDSNSDDDFVAPGPGSQR